MWCLSALFRTMHPPKAFPPVGKVPPKEADEGDYIAVEFKSKSIDPTGLCPLISQLR